MHTIPPERLDERIKYQDLGSLPNTKLTNILLISTNLVSMSLEKIHYKLTNKMPNIFNLPLQPKPQGF